MNQNFSEEEFQEDMQLRVYKERRMKWYRQRYKNSLIISANCDERRTGSVNECQYHVSPKLRSENDSQGF